MFKAGVETTVVQIILQLGWLQTVSFALKYVIASFLLTSSFTSFVIRSAIFGQRCFGDAGSRFHDA